MSIALPPVPSARWPARLPAGTVRRVLAEARLALGMELAYFSEISDTQLVIRVLDGELGDFGLHQGMTVPREHSYCARVASGERPSLVPDALASPAPEAFAMAAVGIGAYAGVPVRRSDGAIYGSLCCVSRGPREDLDARDVRLLAALAAVAGARLEDDERAEIETERLDRERRNAELDNEARFRWLADLVAHQIWIADDERRLRFVNARVLEYYGPGAEAWTHTAQWLDAVHPDDAERAGAIAAAARAENRPYEFGARLRRHDGEYREHVSRAFPGFDEDGHVVRWYGVTTDLTGARAQERLLDSEARLREAQAIARIGSFRWDAERGFMESSDELLALLGMTRDAFGGRLDAFQERVHPDDRQVVTTCTLAADATGEPFAYDARIVLSGGEIRVVHVRGRAALTPDRRPAVLTGTIQDVTDQRTAETAARGQAAAERANEAKSDFLRRMSHELRTPLNAILGFGQLLELDELSADQRDSVGHILKGGAHLLELINEVLEISRIEAGALRVSLEAVPVATTVREVVSLLAPLAAERRVQIRIDDGADPGQHVRADLQRLKQILLNLVSNAIKYNREDGLVTVRTRPLPGGRTRIVVSDTGPGIDPTDLERVFSPFERLGMGDGSTEGTGLGLPLSRTLAEALGGELTVASVAGCGADFELVLDTARPVDPPDAPPAGEADEAFPESARSPIRVLYVEDNPSNLRLVERVLSRAGIEVVGAPQGRLGIDLARRLLPDLVLLDLDLPDVTGEQVLAELAADPRTAAIPVVACSADATAATVERLRAKGAREYLTKPLEVSGLLKAVARITDGKS